MLDRQIISFRSKLIRYHFIHEITKACISYRFKCHFFVAMLKRKAKSYTILPCPLFYDVVLRCFTIGQHLTSLEAAQVDFYRFNNSEAME